MKGLWVPWSVLCLTLAFGIFLLGCWPLTDSALKADSFPDLNAEAVASVDAVPVENLRTLPADAPAAAVVDFLPRTRRPVEISAHRGASKNWPENTMAAFEAAIRERADWIELDVQTALDGEVIVFHDDTLYRLTGVAKYPGDCTWAELEALDVGLWKGTEHQGAQIPRLEEVLALCRNRIRVNVEIKENERTARDSIVRQVVKLIQAQEMSSQCMITAYSRSLLEQVKELDPTIKTALLCDREERLIFDAPEADALSVWAALLTAEQVERANLAGKKVIAWPADTEEDWAHLKSIGVDNIMASDPAGAIAFLYETKPANTEQP